MVHLHAREKSLFPDLSLQYQGLLVYSKYTCRYRELKIKGEGLGALIVGAALVGNAHHAKARMLVARLHGRGIDRYLRAVWTESQGVSLRPVVGDAIPIAYLGVFHIYLACSRE